MEKAFYKSKDGERVFVQSENNPDFFVDETKKTEDDLWADEVLASEAFDIEDVGFAEYAPPIYSRVGIGLLFDMHFGGPGFQFNRAKTIRSFFENTANTILLGGGDNIDCTYGASNTQDQKINATRAEDAFVRYLEPIKHKVIAMAPGNHDSPDGSRNTQTNTARAKSAANRLGIKYFPYGYIVSIDLPLPKPSTKTRKMKIFVFHGSGKANGGAAAVDTTYMKAKNALLRLGIVPDIICAGHFHVGTNGIESWECPKFDDSGLTIGNVIKNIKVISSKSLQGMGPYPAFNNMKATPTNMDFIEVGWQTNPMHSVTRSESGDEYIPEIVQSPILSPQDDELCSFMKDYQEQYPEAHDIERAILEAYGTKSLDDVYRVYKDFLEMGGDRNNEC